MIEGSNARLALQYTAGEPLREVARQRGILLEIIDYKEQGLKARCFTEETRRCLYTAKAERSGSITATLLQPYVQILEQPVDCEILHQVKKLGRSLESNEYVKTQINPLIEKIKSQVSRMKGCYEKRCLPNQSMWEDLSSCLDGVRPLFPSDVSEWKRTIATNHHPDVLSILSEKIQSAYEREMIKAKTSVRHLEEEVSLACQRAYEKYQQQILIQINADSPLYIPGFHGHHRQEKTNDSAISISSCLLL